MRGPIPATEIALALIFISRSFTRIYQRRAVALYGIAGLRAAEDPGSGVVPTWVSLAAVTGWAGTVIAGFWLIVA